MVLAFAALARKATAWALKEDMIEEREKKRGEGGERKRERKSLQSLLFQWMATANSVDSKRNGDCSSK